MPPLVVRTGWVVSALALCSSCVGSDALIKPGRLYAEIDSEHLHVLVPAHAVDKLKPFVARADLIYQRIAHDSGYVIKRPLVLLLNDDAETHNGSSTTVPVPIVDIDIPGSTQASFIFDGDDWLERTFSHELTHHVSNDREPNPFLHAVEEIFGRILPNDDLSLLVAYFTTPAHATMPRFWHEGCAQWSETVYSPPDSPWGGRGRDSLTHMVWRLAAASPEGLPQVADWRVTYQRWPYGTQTYVWGLAYLRYLDGAYGDRVSIWQLIQSEERRWPFLFNRGPVALLGKDHLTLIAEARAALLQEQQRQLAILRSQPVTSSRRLTPVDSVVATPAWTGDGRLFAAYTPQTGDPRYIRVAIDAAGEGHRDDTGDSAWAMGDARSLGDGSLVYTETYDDSNPWNRSQATVITPDGQRHILPEQRVLQADLRALPETRAGHRRYQLAALHLLPAAQQEILLWQADLSGHWLGSDHTGGLQSVPAIGNAWSPSFRPGHDQLAWIETDHAGSRLVLAPLANLRQRTVLATIRGRIIQPTWTQDGARVYFCADHTGVCNAYCIDPDAGAKLVPVTNTIGGVVACVPSPDGRRLAIIDCDLHGPYLAVIPADPATWAAAVPSITLAFPAPVTPAALWAMGTGPAGRSAGSGAGGAGVGTGLASDAPSSGSEPPRWSLPAGPGDVAGLTTHRYHGITEIEPLFWTPTTMVVPTGGYGAVGVAADPIFTHEIIAGIGSGPIELNRPVGMVSYLYGGWPLDVGLEVQRAQYGWDHFDENAFGYGTRNAYAEDQTSATAIAGYGLTGLERTTSLYVGAGVEQHKPFPNYVPSFNLLPLPALAPYVGRERYLEATASYDDTEFFPTSYSYENGNTAALTWRHSLYAGGAHGDELVALGQRVITVWPEQSHQIVLGGLLGWSGGEQILQNTFTIGGLSGIGLPRGYLATVAYGQYAIGASGAYRLPLWRPFRGFTTSPWVFRQLTLEGFFDLAKVSGNRLDGTGHWYKSTGGELHGNWEFWTAQIDPGLGVARQLDATKQLTTYLTLQYGW